MEKELRAYVINANNIPHDFNMSGYSILDWVSYEEQHGRLTDEAERFIQLCEKNGGVYSLYGFMQAINVSDIILLNDYVFITRAY